MTDEEWEREQLHDARGDAHRIFDAFWKKRRVSRRVAYAWLRVKMNLTGQEAHIARMDINQCKKLIQLIEEENKSSQSISIESH